MPRLRCWVTRLLAFVLAAAGGSAGSRQGACAGEPGVDAPPAAAVAERALEPLIELWNLRVRAALAEAEILRSLGRLPEALEASRRAALLATEGVAGVRALAATARRWEASLDDASDLLEDYGPFLPVRGSHSPMRLRGRLRERGAGGGVPRWRDASLHALRWLAALQSPDGWFEADGFGRWCDGKPSEMAASERPDGAGSSEDRVLCTGAALAAFAACGYTHQGDHEFSRPIARGLAALRREQQPDGCIGRRDHLGWADAHALATLAVVDVFGLSGSRALRDVAERALAFSVGLRTPGKGWGTQMLWQTDSVAWTCSQALPLAVARLINAGVEADGLPPVLRLPPGALEGLDEWLASRADPATGLTGRRREYWEVPREAYFPDARETSMSLALRLLLGAEPANDPTLARGLSRLAERPPRWLPAEGLVHLDYFAFGSLAAALEGGPCAKAWLEATFSRDFLAGQRLDGNYCTAKGSWAPADPDEALHGRVYATALLVRVLNAPVLYQLSPATPAAGR